MQVNRWPVRVLSAVLVVTMLTGALPVRSAWADLVATESVITPAPRADAQRARLRALLDREDVRAQLQAYGVSAEEAATRVEALTDREVEGIAGRLDDVPAGAAGHVFVELALLCVAGVVALVVVGIGFVIVKIVKSVANAAKQKAN